MIKNREEINLHQRKMDIKQSDNVFYEVLKLPNSIIYVCVHWKSNKEKMKNSLDEWFPLLHFVDGVFRRRENCTNLFFLCIVYIESEREERGINIKKSRFVSQTSDLKKLESFLVKIYEFTLFSFHFFYFILDVHKWIKLAINLLLRLIYDSN